MVFVILHGSGVFFFSFLLFLTSVEHFVPLELHEKCHTNKVKEFQNIHLNIMNIPLQQEPLILTFKHHERILV